MKLSGKIAEIIGLVIEAHGPNVNLGELCFIRPRNKNILIPAEVVGFRKSRVLLMPVGEMEGIGPGCEVISAQQTLKVPVGKQLLGRILDGLGRPMDDKGPIISNCQYPLHSTPPPPLTRRRISEKLAVGVRAIDGLLLLGAANV